MSIKELAQLKKNTFQKQSAFAYLCCERVYPHYVYFFNNYSFGNIEVFRTAIDTVYNSIFNQSDMQKVELLLQQIDINAPVPGNFTTFYASVAMNAAGVIYESVNLIKQKDVSRILDDISTMCTNAIDLFIQERDDMDYDDPEFETKILNDYLMQQEISIQRGIITYLSKIDKLSTSDIDTLLDLQKNGTGTLVL